MIWIFPSLLFVIFGIENIEENKDNPLSLVIKAILNKLKGHEKTIVDLFSKKVVTLFAKPAINTVTKKGKEKVKEEVIKIIKHDLNLF